jgi:hypothetical protein
MLVHFGLRETVREAAVAASSGLLGCPSVAGKPLGTGSAQPLDGHESTAGLEDPPGLLQTCV